MTNKNPSPMNIEIKEEITKEFTVHKNVKQELILLTEDKAELCLLKNRDYLTAKKEWLIPLSIFLTLLTSLITTEKFKNIIFDSSVWIAIYVISAFVSFVWLICAVKKAWSNRKKGNIDSIIRELKAQTKEKMENPSE